MVGPGLNPPSCRNLRVDQLLLALPLAGQLIFGWNNTRGFASESPTPEPHSLTCASCFCAVSSRSCMAFSSSSDKWIAPAPPAACRPCITRCAASYSIRCCTSHCSSLGEDRDRSANRDRSKKWRSINSGWSENPCKRPQSTTHPPDAASAAAAPQCHLPKG